MLQVHAIGGATAPAGDGALARGAVWIDLADPSAHDLAEAERHFGRRLPTLAHDTSLEPSRRLRDGGDHLVLTLALPPGTGERTGGVATLVLSADALVTLRTATAAPFGVAPRGEAGADALLAVFEALTANAADRLEELAAEIEEKSADVFDANRETRRRAARIERLVATLGAEGARLLRQRECLAGLERAVLFVARRAGTPLVPDEARERLAILQRDLEALRDHAASLDVKIAFLLDAVLGLVSLDQNDVMKMLSVTAAIFMPPTLIAAIYGMNFPDIPDVSWRWGFYVILAVMAASAGVTWGIFRWRRWL